VRDVRKMLAYFCLWFLTKFLDNIMNLICKVSEVILMRFMVPVCVGSSDISLVVENSCCGFSRVQQQVPQLLSSQTKMLV
jgi:hypothetical protein